MSGDASGKPTPSYKEILRSKDKAVRFTELLIRGKEKIEKIFINSREWVSGLYLRCKNKSSAIN